jgi:hypothetical protein
MRRTNFFVGLISSAVAVALVAVVYDIGSLRSPSTVEPNREEANQAQQISSAGVEVNESTTVVSQRSSGDDQIPIDTETPRKTNFVDEATDLKLLREEATQEAPRRYALLLERLDLTPREKDAMLSFLIEDQIASTWTRYKSGIGMDEHERSSRIAAIISDSKRQQFFAMERNISEYVEVQNVQSMLNRSDVPLTDARRDELLRILVGTRNQLSTALPEDVNRRSIEALEHRLAQIDEYERLVLEQASSALSPKQVQYLFERYQRDSYRRADSLEAQKKSRADDSTENLPLHYPARIAQDRTE